MSPRRQGDPRPRPRTAGRVARQGGTSLGRPGQPEFLRSQIEVGTHVCRSVQEARDQLVELRSTVGATAAEFGLAPIAASTHPFAHWDSQHHTNKERYNLLAQDLQYVVRRLVICGMHVHIGIDDDDLRIDLLSQAPYFLPHLLALSTSSPFWQGEATGLKSYRLSVFDELPRTGIPHTFSSYSEYERTIELMVSAGLIEDATKIWWDLRPSARFPTLEMRVTDVCPLVEDAIAIAALFQCILRLLYRLRRQNQRWRHYPPFLIRENRWRAQRYGIEEGMVDFGRGAMVPFSHLIEELFELVAEDAAYFGCTREVAHARTIMQRGTSADRQLKCYEKAKAAGASQHEALIAVVDELVAETAALPGASTKAVLEGENA
nr:carboxylate-amine ligase [Methyloceanibacter sp. wino2]